MIDIKLIRENEDLVKENIKKKFQDDKLPLVDEVYELDERTRKEKAKGDEFKKQKEKISSEIGKLMRQGKKWWSKKVKKEVAKLSNEIEELEKRRRQI